MERIAIIITMLLCICENSEQQQILCQDPKTGRPRYRIGSTFTKTKPFEGVTGATLYGTYNCECRNPGYTYCTADDIPCFNSDSRLFSDLNEKVKVMHGGTLHTCICKRGRGSYRNCVSESSTQAPSSVRCRDYNRRPVRVGERYLIRSLGGMVFSCECGSNGMRVTDTCREHSESSTQAPTSVRCRDYNRQPVRVGERYLVRSLGGLLFSCECGSNGIRVAATCRRHSDASASTNVCESASRCQANEICHPLGGQRYQCRCKPGYRRYRSSACTDYNECAYSYGRRSRCDDNAVCTNTPGSYTCQCEEGFTGDGITCQIMDHCTENLSQCDMNARCISSASTFQCVCNDGYEGNGATCTEIDRCSRQTECDINAECKPTQNSYVCHCLDGYSGDGYTCQKQCWDEIANEFVSRGETFLRLSPTTGQQEGCTCGVGGVSIPGSCIGAETTTTTPATTTTSTTQATSTTTTEAVSTTTAKKLSCYRRGAERIVVGGSYYKTIGGRRYVCICYERRGRAVTRCRGA